MVEVSKTTPYGPVRRTVGTMAAIAAELVPTNDTSQTYGGSDSGTRPGPSF